jgi:hypothetical protein
MNFKNRPTLACQIVHCCPYSVSILCRGTYSYYHEKTDSESDEVRV